MIKKKYLVIVSISLVAMCCYLVHSQLKQKEIQKPKTFEDHVNDYDKFTDLGHYHHAHRAIKAAIKIKPDDSKLLWQASSTAQIISNNAESISFAKKAWDNGLKTRDIILRIYSLRKSHARSNFSEQDKLLKMAYQLSSNEDRVLTHGDLLIQFNKFNEAWDLWRKYFENKPSSIIAQRIANCYIIKKDYLGGINFLADCYRKELLKEKGLLTYSRLYFLAGRYDAAKIVLSKARIIYPESKNVLLESAYCDFLMNNYAQSLKTLKLMDDFNLQDNDNHLINKRLLQANIYYIQKDLKSIEQLIDEVYSDDPKIEGEILLYNYLSNNILKHDLPVNKISRLLPKLPLSQLLIVQFYHSQNKHNKVLEYSNTIADSTIKLSPLLTKLWISSALIENQHLIAEELIKRQFARGLYTKAYFDQLAMIYTLNKKPQSLRRIKELKIKFFPSDKNALEDLILVHLKAKDFELAKKLLDEKTSYFNPQEVNLYEEIINQNFSKVLKLFEVVELNTNRLDQLKLLVIDQIEVNDISSEFKKACLENNLLAIAIAYRYLDSNNINVASEIFKNFSQNKDLFEEATIGLCIAKLQSGKFADAKVLYEKIKYNDPKSINFNILKITFALNDEGGDKAMSLINSLPLYFRSNRDINILTIKALMLQKKWTQATNLLHYNNNQLCKTRREKLLLAECYIRLKQFNMAMSYIEDNELEFNSPPIVSYMAIQNSIKNNKPSKAKAIIKSSLGSSDDIQLLLAQVAIDRHLEKHSNIIKILNNKLDNPNALYYWSEAMIKTGRFDDFEKKINLLNIDVNDLTRLAIICESLKLHSEAVKLYRITLNKQEKNAQIHNNIAWNLYLDGQFDTAIKDARIAYDISPHNDKILHTYSSILNANKLYEQTISLLKQNEFFKKSNSPKLLFNLAESYRNLNRNDEALSTYKACLGHISESDLNTNIVSIQNVKNYIASIEAD